MRSIFALVVVGAMLSAATFANVSVMTVGKGDPLRLRWRTPVVKLAVSTSLLRPGTNIKSDSDVTGAISRSIAAWNSVADIELTLVESDRQSISPSGPAGDGVNLVTIAQTPENVLLFSKDPNAESARTRVFYNRLGTITEADIVLNPLQQFSTDGTFGTFDLEATLTHEIGHLLGLRHSPVMGSVLNESLARNGILTPIGGSRGLYASDIAAVRQIYGAKAAEDCCATVSGKLTSEGGRPARGVRIWAEENGTGRVIASAESSTDGAYALGGLAAGDYALLWQPSRGDAASQIGHLGMVRLSNGETRTLNGRVSLKRASVDTYFVGLNSQLTDAAITLEAGREHQIFIGGVELDRAQFDIEFNSPYFVVVPGSMQRQDFGDDVSVVSVVVKISPETPAGAYSIFATNDIGIQASLIGAMIVK